MERLKFAPLRYSLAIVRFPRLLNMEPHVGNFQEQIRHQYPLPDTYMNQGLVAEVGPEGVRFNQVLDKLWQFADPERKYALVLGSDFLLIHAGAAYEGHGPFLDRLRDAVFALMQTPGMGITHATALGLRVIDLVEPRSGNEETVAQYLCPWALPTAAADMGDGAIEMREGAYIASFSTPHGGLRFQALRRPGGSFPADLATPFVQNNGWLPQVTAEDFVILDIDHFAALEPPIALNPVELREKFEGLYLSSRKVFESAATPFAFEVWGRTG
ncbi:hypothetical protein BKE38_07755 [Pseudoroseomonas deserti]|uniref:TIGR04255 family protein n=3 Tax=Roseomonas TaxID=125216 RepID=A0A379N4R1_9PROT|nr:MULTISPECIES: TIGR04255 family protein [Acetobacteraceae]MBS5901369.1 TIGR04255 family protein [Acetobacteraceae bacterium]APT57290.1 hypothetical protein RGI145_09425 [Roseomonas gilardii]MCG7350240.1 TIGR04255 family protein [Roseomonas mucosa]MCG7356016.1 TIGR04255 family protein [Roseomonas mucosa]MDT8292774.1 TIGR04255 family protein [Roseomonas mucosa]